MFLTDAIRRRIAALLQPWLKHDDDDDDSGLELKLGFLRSTGTLNDVSLDTAALNDSLDDPSRYCFKEATVEHLSLQFSPFSAAAFTLVVRGLRIVLSLGELKDERGERWRRKAKDTALEERNKALEEIDPEGCALHGAIKSISEVTTRTWRSSLLNSVLRHCQLQLQDVHVLLQPHSSHDPFSCSLYTKRVGVASQFIGFRCFIRGFMSSFFVPPEESLFDVDINSFEIRLAHENRSSSVVPPTNITALAKLNNIQFISFSFHVPALKCSFSPIDVYVILSLYGFLSKESKGVRPGRHLWNIVASRISSLVLTSKPSFTTVVWIVCLWLRYIKAYLNILVLVKYPVDKIMKRSAALMFRDARYSRSVKLQWRLIGEIENDLSLEAIALARRVVRFRVSSSGPGENDSFHEMPGDGLFLKLHQLLVLISNLVGCFLNLIARILFLHKIFSVVPEEGRRFNSVCEDFPFQENIYLNVQEISISFYPEYAAQSSVRGKAISDAAFTEKDLLSFHFSIDAFFLRYMSNITEGCFTFAFGCFKVVTVPVTKVRASSYLGEHSKKELSDSQIIILAEPAQVIYSPETTHYKANDGIGSSVPHLAGLLEQLWLNWKKSLMELGEENMGNMQTPWVLCETRTCLKDKSLNSWLWNCYLIVGRLHFTVEYAALASISVLLRQMQCVLGWIQNRKDSVHLSSPSIEAENIQVSDWRNSYVVYSSKLEMEIIRMLPEKHIQIAAFVTGPHVRVSLINDEFPAKKADHGHLATHVSFDIRNIELLVSPTLENSIQLSGRKAAELDKGPGCLGLEEPQEIRSPDSNEESYSCHGQISLNAYLKVNGLKAYFDKSSENQKCQIILLRPITMQLGYVRKNYYSFGSSTVTCSAASHFVADGFASLIFLDELYLLTEVIFGVLHKSLGFAIDGMGHGLSYEEVSNEETAYLDSKGKRSFSVRGKSFGVKAHVFVNSTCELKSIDIILHNSRKCYNTEDYMNLMSIDRVTGEKLAMHNFSGKGIYVSVQSAMMDFIFGGGNLDIVIATTGIRSCIFRYLTETEGSPDTSELNSLLRSLNFLSEASVSHSKLYLWLRSFGKASTSANMPDIANESNSDRKTLHGLEDSPMIVNSERLENHWLFTNFILSEIYIAGCQIKDVLTIENKFEKFTATLSVGQEFQTISYQSKGGSIILEGTAAAMFVESFTSYYHQLLKLSLSSWTFGNVAVSQHSRETVALDYHRIINSQKIQRQAVIWNLLKVVSMSILRLSVVLVARDESGNIQELFFEIDFNWNLELLNTTRKFSMGVTKLSMLSQFMHGLGEPKVSVLPRHPPPPVMPGDSSSSFSNKDSAPFNLQHKDKVQTSLAGSSGSSRLVSVDSSDINCSMGTQGHRTPCISPLNYILKELHCSLEVEGPMTREQGNPSYSHDLWVGSGSISGFDLTISLYEIKMVLSAFESFSEALISDKTSPAESTHQLGGQEAKGNMEEIIADGTIVAVQDVDQHMYIAVGGAESKYGVVGAVHYSLVGERALFRVKYHNPRWKSSVRYFSLISCYAKDASGGSLRLNCRPRSRFVEISCSDDCGPALWTMLPFRSDAYADAMEEESSSSLSRKNFHLVNKKNDCAVAFIDGILEFVSKPGNLFKWKVFGDPGPAGHCLLNGGNVMDRHSTPTNGELLSHSRTKTIQQNDLNISVVEESRKNENLLGITIAVDKVTVTLVHQLSAMEEKFPLLQGSILPNKAILQISNSKVRFINTIEVVLYYFDAQRNLWREFIQPVEICIFYYSKFHNQGPENISGRVSSHFHARIKEVAVFVSEHSLDILLFVTGNLDLAGPYAVKSSVVLANCCKVENQTGLTLLCQFYDNQDASISARQSTTIFLRHLALANQAPEASFFSLQLFQHAPLGTTPLRLSLLEARHFAWRTRIISSQDSKSFPGPFIVVEISRGIQDGLSIVVSPLLRIYNDTDFSLELRFQRPEREESESALLVLKAGDVVDDATAAFSATDLSGGLRKALTSLTVGNYIFSFRPDMRDLEKSKNLSVEWSDDLKGGKPIRLSGIFDKLSYEVKKAFSIDSAKFSLSSANCALKSEEGFVTSIHFLIQTVAKSVPVMNPDNVARAAGSRTSSVTMQEQREFFVLPTIRVSNLLHTEIHVTLTDREPGTVIDCDNTWKNATIPCGSAAKFYANPTTIVFEVTLTSFGSRCKPVNSSDWVRKLQKQKGNIRHFDIELDFSGGKYSAMLRLFRGHRGTLEAAIFTPYSLQNDTSTSLLCFAANQKPLSRTDIEKFGSVIPPDLGSYLPPNSVTSWFLKYHKLRFKLLEEKALEAQLDLDALSGLAEIDLEAEETFGSKSFMRLGVSLKPSVNREISSHIVGLNSRYVVCNESEDAIAIRQCYMENVEDFIALNSKKSVSLRLKTVLNSRKETNIVENLLRKHIKSQNDSSLFIQFRPYKSGLGWSGPVCVASLGRFFLKFRSSTVEFPERQSTKNSHEDNLGEFASVHVVEEGSTIVVHFHRPPITNLPYRIENCLRDAPITYYQKGSSEPETLGAGSSANYVWDDLTLSHKLLVQLDDVHLLREINLDKVRTWKPLYRRKQTIGLGSHLPLDKKSEDQKRSTYGQLLGTETVKVGYEVYAEGVTRVLRICERADSHKLNIIPGSSTRMRLRISYFAIHLLEHAKQEIDLGEPSHYVPIIIAKLEGLNLDSMSTDQHKYYQTRLQSLSIDEKWLGAPFSTMLRRHQSEKSDADNYVLHVALVLLPTISSVKQVKYLSIVLQPLDLNLDEETLMKIVPFWRKSLSDSSTPRPQYYFDHFEIHPIKIVTTFLPGDTHYSYSSTQETLRSLLHSVIKIPAIKSKTVELNGVLVTHALITLRELTIKCAQHYSWYTMRAIYIAKGSPLLPPAFASVFDDLASSSLDVFFDPSSGLVNLPGMTIGTLKLISKFIDNKGFSGTKRYFGDLGKTLKTAGSNVLFAAVTEISDSVLKGAETSGFNGMVNGFHQGILKLAMEPSVLSSAVMEGGPDRRIKLDRSPGVDELYIEGYLQAMLDTMYKQEYLRVRVVENQVILKNLPPSSSLINEIVERVKDYLASKALLKVESSTASHSLRHIRGEREWRIGPTVLTLCEHLFVSFAIQMLRRNTGKVMARIPWKSKVQTADEGKAIVPATGSAVHKVQFVWKWGIGKFVLSGIIAYIDGRLCRHIPNPLARRIVSGFLLSFLDRSEEEQTK